MRLNSIFVSGNLISQELIDKLDDDNYQGQRPSDFGLESGVRTRQDIARAWTDANDYWKIFKRKLDALKDTEKGTTETRSQWMIPLLGLLGYDLNYIPSPEIINEKSYDISHRVTNRDSLPVIIVSAKDDLDKKPEGQTRYRMSPHALLQEYLNVTEHTYGLVTNGKLLRLLRDNGRITRLTYLEFDLEKIFEEDLYADFALLYRLLHVSRMPLTQSQASESILENYYQKSLDAGTRIRNNLSKAVESAIKILANGLLKHPDNADLVEQLKNGKLTSLEFYQLQLRMIYRLLFTMTIEERKLVYPESLGDEQQRLRDIYYQYYSLQQLRNLAGKRHLVQARHHNIYIQLWHCFRLQEKQIYAEKLGMYAMGSGLFEAGKLQPLDRCKMYNKDLLDALYHLSYFIDDESGQIIRVNYGALNVEEFGSVYEGLLEYQAQVTEVDGNWQFVFVKSTERSKSGSHYTPEELVQPLIKHSLEYLIENRIKEKDPVAALLSLKVCDVACGSGHILLSAARRITLEVARKQFKEEQPSPEHLRWATRKVIINCIYGVDKNPLAVELCKVAMWLESHSPGEPLNFLDHHIKCGDAIVGLAHKEELEKGITDEAFKALPDDDKTIATSFQKRNKQERKQRQQASFEFEKEMTSAVAEIIEQYNVFRSLPERTPEEVLNKEKQFHDYEEDYRTMRLQQLADAQVAQFFIPKTEKNKSYFLTDAEYRIFLNQASKHIGLLQSQKLAKAQVISDEKKFFHWFIEFPEVFSEGGFDCVLGNPPFLGGQKLSGTYGEQFLEFIKYEFAPIGAVDLVTYFFRRIFTIIKQGGFQSLISTNTIAQGKAREDGLDILVQQGGTINHAIKSMRWPGMAAVEVALVTLTKQKWNGKFVLSGKEVTTITPYLDDAATLGNPVPLKQNEGKAFQGSIPLGKGFVLEKNEAQDLIAKNPTNRDVLFPYLNGDDLNNNPDQSSSRWVINFFDWPEDKAKKYPDCYEIVQRLVKPERQRPDTNMGRDKWWQFYRRGLDLYQSINGMKKVIALCEVTKHLTFAYVETGSVYTANLDIFSLKEGYYYSLIQNNLHYYWAWTYCAWLKRDLKYSPGNGFQTFPFPQNIDTVQKQQLELISESYHELRRQLMLGMQLGLTKTYNLFHSNAITAQSINQNDKQVTSLLKHFEKTPKTISFDEAIKGILKLRELHVQMDEAVLDAYGWNDIALKHDFYEVDYLPENDRGRFTIHPDARKEVLKRLLDLNHQIHEEEVKAGLWDKKGKKTPKYRDEEESLSQAAENDEDYGGLFSQK